MDSHEAARRYLAGEMDVNEYDAIVEQNTQWVSASTETLWAKEAHKLHQDGWRVGFLAGVGFTLSVGWLALALLGFTGVLAMIVK